MILYNIIIVNRDDSRKKLNLSFVDLSWTTAHPIQLLGDNRVELCGADKKRKGKTFSI
jgi:hypothetical protein